MKLTLERGALLKALNHATSVVEKRTTIPILTHVMLIAEGDTLQLKATDLDIEIVEAVKAEIAAPGGCTVSAEMIYNIVRKLPEGAEITLATDAKNEGRVTLRAGHARFSLAALPADDFPDLGASELPHSFSLPAKSLVKLIEKTRFAISTEETRYYLNGIYLHAIGSGDEGVLRAVATDGHRLAQIDVSLPVGAEGIPGVIVPRKTIGEMLKLIADLDADVGLELSENKIRITTRATDGSPQVILTSKLIDGAFPDYGRVVPQGNNKIMQVLNSDFIRAVDRVSTLSVDKGRAVKLNIAPDSLILSVNNPDSGSAVEELAAVYTDTPLEIGFNSRYLLDIAAEIEGGHIIFILSDPSSPTIVKDEGNDSALYVLMPMRC
jgi:DNA polymerase III subunit beta